MLTRLIFPGNAVSGAIPDSLIYFVFRVLIQHCDLDIAAEWIHLKDRGAHGYAPLTL